MPVANDAVWLEVLPDMSKFGPTLATGAQGQAKAAGATTGKAFGLSMLKGVAVVAGGAALATKALYNIGATFDDMSDTIRVGTGATGKALDALNASAKRVGKNTPASFEDVGTAIADVNTRLGLTGKPLEEISTQFLELSRITKTDVAANIENVSRVFGDWGVEADKQSESLDFLFKVSQSTGIGIDDLSQKVVQFGAPMRQFGFSFEESAALMGKWEKEGVNTETIMGGLRAGLGKLAKAGKDPAKAFETITKQIADAGSRGEATAIAIETFGQRAGPDLAAAVREGRFDLEDLLGTLKGSKETIRDAGKDTMDFSEHWRILKNKAMAGLEPLATRVFTALGKGADWMNAKGIPALKRMKGFVEDNSTAFKVLAGVVTGLIVVTRIHSGLMAVRAAGGLLAMLKATKLVSAVTKTYTAVQWLMNAALTANPIGLVVAGLALLAAGLVIAWKKSETFRRIVTAVWDAVKGGALGMVQFVVDKVLWMVEKVIGMMAKIPGPTQDAFKNAAETVKNFREDVNRELDAISDEEVKIGFRSTAKASDLGRGIQRFGGGGGRPGTGAFGGAGLHPRVKADMAGVRRVAASASTQAKAIATEVGKSLPAGRMGKKGSVLPRGRYSVGMPYLGYPGHYGADYPASTGTPVYSLAGGVVTRAMTMSGSYGKHVYVAHPGGVETRYAHLNSYGVRAGQQVRAGQPLGTVGSTGNSTGPHLHFEYRKNGAAINPANLGIFDNGGLLKQGMLAYHAARKPDRVLTDSQWADMHKIAQRAGSGSSGPAIHQHFPSSATPQSAAAAAGARAAAALTARGV